MASVDYQHSILWRGEDPLKKKFAPRRDDTKKVVRYFPGKTPRWAEGEGGKEAGKKEEAKRKEQEEEPDLKRKRRKHAAAVIVEAKEDAGASRLKRLQASSGAREDAGERLLRHRARQAAVLEEGLKGEDDEDKDEAKKSVKEEEEEEQRPPRSAKKEELEDAGRGPLAELKLPIFGDIDADATDDVELRMLRRERARELALQRRTEEEDVLKEELGDEAEEAEDEDDSEESDSDDDPRRSTMLKPVFVSKAQRETVREKEAQQREEEAAQKRELERKQERKVESKTLVVDKIKSEVEAEAAAAMDDKSDVELLDDDDEKNEAEEYELWKIRELKRIKRDKEERLARQQELELIERRRRMTDAEREEDDRRMDDGASKRDDVKAFNFLQKYYHRGGFFQDKANTGEEPLYLRDYHEPLAEEKFDKNLLPKAMQLRRGQFGKKGQVKHTHLTEVDTTDMSAAWSQHSKVMQKYQEKMAGAKGVNHFDRPGAAPRPSE